MAMDSSAREPRMPSSRSLPAKSTKLSCVAAFPGCCIHNVNTACDREETSLCTVELVHRRDAAPTSAAMASGAVRTRTLRSPSTNTSPARSRSLSAGAGSDSTSRSVMRSRYI